MRKPLALVVLALLTLAALMPSGSSELAAQDTSAREMSREESQALESWARILLETLPERGIGNGPIQRETEVRRLWALYFLAVDHRSRVDDARNLAEELLDTDPKQGQDVTVRALSGALEVVRAKHSRWPPNKLKYLRGGIEALDQLVLENPGAPAVRYLRLMSCYYLPFFLEREESVDADFRALSGLLPQGPGAMPAPVYLAAVEFLLAKGDLREETRAQLRGILE